MEPRQDAGPNFTWPESNFSRHCFKCCLHEVQNTTKRCYPAPLKASPTVGPNCCHKNDDENTTKWGGVTKHHWMRCCPAPSRASDDSPGVVCRLSTHWQPVTYHTSANCYVVLFLHSSADALRVLGTEHGAQIEHGDANGNFSCWGASEEEPHGKASDKRTWRDVMLLLLLADTELCTMRDKDGDQTFAKPLGKNHPCWNQTPLCIIPAAQILQKGLILQSRAKAKPGGAKKILSARLTMSRGLPAN